MENTTPFAGKPMTVAALIAKLQEYVDPQTIIVAHLLDEEDLREIAENENLTREECRILAAHADRQLDSEIGLTNDTIKIHYDYLEELNYIS